MTVHRILLLATLCVAPLGALAQDTSGTTTSADAETTAVAGTDTAEAAQDNSLTPRATEGLTLDEFQWTARPIIVFADTPADPRFIEQMELLTERSDALLERDVVVLFDTDPDARSEIRRALRPRGFSVVIIGKDGAVGLRRPAPRNVREIIRAIDNFQLRQEELSRGG